MGELIEFPLERRREVPLNGQVEFVGMDECTGVIHVFVEVPGRCKCGENEWRPDHTIEPEGIGVHVGDIFFDPPAS